MERRATVQGTLYDVNGRYPALVLDGEDRVEGEVWRGPATLLPELDEYEGVADGLFGRVKVVADGESCWTYVAGPLLAPRLTPEQRIASGAWTGPTTAG
jgi:gamma-glutamylcyclotransferase (GGCT)/AIG2-like uncharacterized protein YtfP